MTHPLTLLGIALILLGIAFVLLSIIGKHIDLSSAVLVGIRPSQ